MEHGIAHTIIGNEAEYQSEAKPEIHTPYVPLAGEL